MQSRRYVEVMQGRGGGGVDAGDAEEEDVFGGSAEAKVQYVELMQKRRLVEVIQRREVEGGG